LREEKDITLGNELRENGIKTLLENGIDYQNWVKKIIGPF